MNFARSMAFLHNLSTDVQYQLDRLLEILLNVPIPKVTDQDVIVWKQTPNDNYTIKLFYLFLKKGPLILSDLHVVWDLKIPPTMQVFIWTMVRNKILTIDVVKRRGWSIVEICYMCRSNDESTNHLFNECQFFSKMLLFRRLNISMMVPYHDSTQEIILNRAIRTEIREVIAIVCFVV
jgi:zinc-binding in reverse transcriptase